MVLPAFGLNRAGVIARLPTWDPRFFWAALALVAAILLGALIIAWTDRWRKRPAQDRLGPKEQLGRFRTLYESGEISTEEFNRIHALLTARIMEELDLPAGPTNQPGVTPSQPQDAPTPGDV